MRGNSNGSLMTLAQSTRYKLYQPVVLTDQFVVTFPIFATEDITVYVDGVVETLYTINATFVNGRATNAQVVLNTPVTDVDVEIYGTRSPRRENNYLGNSPSLSDNLQNDVDAVTAVQQEQSRDFSTSLRTSAGAPPVSPLAGDAAARADRTIKFTADGLGIEYGPNASDITEAQNHALKAKQWAEEDEDVEVETGEYSAKHHSAKSAGWATTAAAEAAAAAASAASINPTQVVVVNGSDTVLLSHNNAVLFCTTTLTLSLTAAAALGNGFKLTVIADGGDVTIDPNGSETIDLAPSLLLRRGEIVSFVGDGTEFWSLSRLGNPDQLFDVTSPVASLAFDVPPGVKTARITYDNFEPVNNDDALGLQIGVNGSGGAFLTTSSYFNHYVNLVVATVNGSQITTTHFGISTQIDNALPTPHGYGYGEVVIQGLNQASEVVKIFGSRGGFNSSAQQIGGMFNGRITSTEDNFNAIRLIGSTGNINKLRGRIEWGY